MEESPLVQQVKRLLDVDVGREDFRHFQFNTSKDKLYVAMHPGFRVFWDDHPPGNPPNRPLLEHFVDTLIRRIQGYAATGRQNWKAYYHQAIEHFWEAYDILAENSFLMNLGRQKKPCLIILEEGSLTNTPRRREYASFLEMITGNGSNFFIVRIDQKAITPPNPQPTAPEVSKLKKMFGNTAAVDLFGEYLNNCLNGAESLFKLCGYKVTVLVDNSVTDGLTRQDTVTKGGYPRLAPQAFSYLERAIGQSAQDQFEVLNHYKNLTRYVTAAKRSLASPERTALSTPH